MVAQQKMKEEEVTEIGADAAVQAKQPGSPKSRLAMLKRSTAKKAAAAAAATDPFRFQGNGVTYKAKLIGERDVEAARGDTMCADAMRDAKAAVKAAGAHKQRIQLSINIDGIKISDEKATIVLHQFPVSRISFIARDTTDARAFGFVFGQPDGKYKFYGIKTAQTADHAVLAIRDMFQIVYEMKRKQVEQMKLDKDDKNKKEMEDNGVRSDNGVLVADLLDLETELQNIEQGVNQLAHIPVMAGDEWPGEVSQNTTGGQDSFGGLIDAFGQQPFGAAAATPAAADPFGDSFTMPQQQQPAAAYGSASLLQMQSPLFMQQQPAAAAQQQPLWGISPMQQQQPMMHHGFSTSTPNFANTNPFASPMTHQQPQQQPYYTNVPLNTTYTIPQQQQPAAAAAARDPFDTSAFSTPSVNWNMGNENTAPAAATMSHAHSFQANFPDTRSTPTFEAPAARQTPTHQWENAGSRKVSSLEEAFTKLVDMNSLVSQPTTKKNPFDHLINPPKVPLNALSHPGAAPAPAAGPALVFPGKTNDPFADDFFN